jgi:hypothetical protein
LRVGGGHAEQPGARDIRKSVIPAEAAMCPGACLIMIFIPGVI